jgi:hypothetical protein
MIYKQIDIRYEAILDGYRKIIKNANEVTCIRNRLAPFGYNESHLQKGLALCEEVDELLKQQRSESKAKDKTIRTYLELKEIADLHYRRVRKIAQYVFRRDLANWQALRLGLMIPERIDRWLNFVTFFYEALLEHPMWRKPLEPFGYNHEVINQLYQQLNELKNLQEKMLTEDGVFPKALLRLNAKLEKLKNWCNDLSELVPLICEEDDNRYLENIIRFEEA